MASSSPSFLLSTPFHCSTSSSGKIHLFPGLTPAKLPFPSMSSFSGSKLETGSREVSGKWKSKVSFFSSFLKKKGKDKETLKKELLEAIAPLDRGADTSEEERELVEQITRELEALRTIKAPLKSNLLNGKWELLYTTSRAILNSERPKFLRPNGKMYQAINADTLRAQNMETWPYFNQVTADLTPLNARKVGVKFDYFKIAGLIPIKAPEKFIGELEVTYLDEELRVSRGDKGNLFILKMVDPSYRVPLQ